MRRIRTRTRTNPKPNDTETEANARGAAGCWQKFQFKNLRRSEVEVYAHAMREMLKSVTYYKSFSSSTSFNPWLGITQASNTVYVNKRTFT